MNYLDSLLWVSALLDSFQTVKRGPYNLTLGTKVTRTMAKVNVQLYGIAHSLTPSIQMNIQHTVYDLSEIALEVIIYLLLYYR